MDTFAFLEKLSKLLSSTDIETEFVLDRRSGGGTNLGAVPRLFGVLDNYPVKFDFLSTKEVVLEINCKPQHYMFITHFNKLTNVLKKIKMSGAVELSDENFNKKYNLRDVSKETAEKTLTKENISLLESIEPFDLFRMTFKEYRIIKDIKPTYTPENAFNDLNNFVLFVKNCDAYWNTDRIEQKPIRSE